MRRITCHSSLPVILKSDKKEVDTEMVVGNLILGDHHSMVQKFRHGGAALRLKLCEICSPTRGI